MNCRLCNEKIPRMRALFKKSDFCCDEHAEQYKDQTLDRLLTESEQPADSVAPLPLPAADGVPLASLESRTPLLNGQTAHGGPRRLPPPKPLLPQAESQSGFGGLLDRLPANKPTPAPSGNIGGWDQAGGEDPLEALLRLESAATAPPAGLGPSRAALPSEFDSGPGAAASSEDDAISALRRLAEEARQSARPKPAPAPGSDAGGEDPFARLTAGEWDTPQPPSAKDLWASEGGRQIAAGEADGESRGDRFPSEGLDGDQTGLEGETADGLSMFDRLVRDFHSDTGPTPADPFEPSVLPLPAAFQPTAGEAPDSEKSPEEEDAPFAGSMFDRLMADAPRPKPPKAIEPVPADSVEAAATDSSAAAPPDELIEAPVAVAAERADAADQEGNAPEASAAEAVEPEKAEAATSRPESGQVQEPRPAARARSRKAAPIAARTELLELTAAGWPVENGSTGDSESLKRLFAEQRASEAALHAPGRPVPVEPSRINVPVRGEIHAAASGSYGKAGAIPWRVQLQPAAIGSPGGEALEATGPWQPAGQASEPIPAAPRPRMPDLSGANGHSPERFRAVSIAGRVIEIDSAKSEAIPPNGAPLPRLECLPSREYRTEPPPLLERGAANGRGKHCRPWLELANAPPASELAGPPAFVNDDPVALPPRVAVRLPGVEQNGSYGSTETATLPGAVAGLVGAEPRGSRFDTADLEQMRRLVAEQTATAVGENGGTALGWNPALASEPFHPALNVENGNRP